MTPYQKQRILGITEILKKRFNNLSATETFELVCDILMKLEELAKEWGDDNEHS